MFIQYIKEETRRAFLSKEMILAVLLSIVLFFIGILETMSWIFSGSTSVLYAFLQGYNSGTANFLIIAFPLIVCMPFATSYRIDKLTGFDQYLLIRLKKKHYKIIRWFVNGFAGGFALFIGPFIGFIFLFICKLIFQLPMIKEETETAAFFNIIGIDSAFLMIMIILLNLFICGFVFSSLGIGVSTLINNRYVAMLVPFIFLIISGTILTKLNIYLNALTLYDIHHFGMSIIQKLVYFSILLGVSGILFFGGERIKALWES
ncbi:hypothetical protein K6959_00670 [Bacillus aquiflavi]|uniref:hypothetical protein n=1 Tax=Bacillus aquiflavi TaxID=2672567 RepID=UPI001CA81B8D|nr:hypothetical protein [Bacillus aquiflavi]UAC48553.1 hypothetical protein K6959_00670 [Bacillus aquiflavi]